MTPRVRRVVIGRSNAMPAWSRRLSDEQIRTVVAYMRSLSAGGASGTPGRKETP
jgi:mono/diheme cytochrome c family protein